MNAAGIWWTGDGVYVTNIKKTRFTCEFYRMTHAPPFFYIKEQHHQHFIPTAQRLSNSSISEASINNDAEHFAFVHMYNGFWEELLRCWLSTLPKHHFVLWNLAQTSVWKKHRKFRRAFKTNSLLETGRAMTGRFVLENSPKIVPYWLLAYMHNTCFL